MFSLIVEIESHGMADEVLGAGFELEFLVDHLHAVLIQINALDCSVNLISSTARTGSANLGEWPGPRLSIPGETRRISSPSVSQTDPLGDW